MAYQDNRRVKAAFIKATTWGTLVTPNASNCRIPIRSFSMVEAKAKQADESLTGKALSRQSFDVGSFYKGSLGAYLDGVNFDVMIAQLFGTAGSPAQQALTTAYTNRYQIADAGTEGKFGTLSIDKVIDVFTFDSVKIIGMHVVLVAGKAAEVSFDLVGRFMGLGSGSVQTSTVTTLASATFRAKPKTAEYVWNDPTHCVVRMNAQAGGSLSSGDNIYPSKITLDYVFPFDDQDVTGSNVPCIDEPLNSGYPIITGSFEFPTVRSIADLEAVQSPSLKKASIGLVGKTDSAGTGYPFQTTFMLPCLKLLTADTPVTGAKKEGKTLRFECTLPDDETANPTGMSDVMPYIDVQNTLSASPLA